ncbi:MAG: PAS domain S-box protein, partial [Gammaproteobacteria bacterium]|nr:PAS domain S-box protein [Gammaproteobacteria bacterium]
MNNRPVIIAVVLLSLFFSGSVWLVFEYVSAEKKRDIEDWQARLSIMAESQQHAVEAWLDVQVENINTLSSNPLLQLYVSQRSADKTLINETERGQLSHLKNLINATAERARVFTPINEIKNNIKSDINDGMAIVDEAGVLLATRYFPVHDEKIKQSYHRAVEKKAVYISNITDMRAPGATEPAPRLIIIVPVSSVQAMNANDIRAAVVAVINPENNLYKLLLKEWLTTTSEESLLVSLTANNINYLSRLKQGYEVFHQQVITGEKSQGFIAESIAAKSIGSFSVLPDYRQLSVLATARLIHNTTMILVQKIDVNEALFESRSHQKFILTSFLLVVFIITISFIAIWKHATSLRLQKAKQRLEARTALLNAVGDSIKDHMFLLDHKNKLVFINDALAKSFHIDNVDIRGKALNHVFNNEITEQLLEIKPGKNGDNIRNKEMRLAFNKNRYDYHVSVMALNHTAYKQSHLFVMHDITEIKDAQGKHNRLMDGIISTLAHVIDKHDPHCEHHSQRTREVAIAIAGAMGLPKERVDVLAMAALLANIGKLYIPTEILTNMEPLTEEESLVLRENINYSVEILKDLEFGGPVIEFVQQKN